MAQVVLRGDAAKVAAASMVGTGIEWYDYYISGTAAALAWPSVFFPTQNPFTAVLASFVLYGVGFVGRPLGALIFGHFGDRIGRRSALSWTLVWMGAGTLLIGLTPGFGSIGVAGGFIISFARIVQGIGVGGEVGGAAVWMTETVARSRRRGAWSSAVQFGSPIGTFTSAVAFTAVTALLTHADFLSYGWRIPFLIGALVALVGLIIRRRLPDTGTFKSLQERRATERTPSLRVLWEKPGLVLTLAAIPAFINAAFYLNQTFRLSYLTTGLHMSSSFAASLGIYGSVGNAFWVSVGAYLSDRVGRKRLILVAATWSALFPYASFMMLNTMNTTIIILSTMLGVAGVGYAQFASFIPEQFPAKYRYSGTSIANQLSSPFAGGLAPIIGAAIVASYGISPGWIYVSVMLSAYSVLSLVATLVTHETMGGVLTESGVERSGSVTQSA